MKVKLVFKNKTDFRPDFDLRKTAEKVIKHVLKAEGCPFDCEVNLTVTGEEEIHAVNKEFREVDAPTDVLSFPGAEFANPADFEDVMASPLYAMNINPDSGCFVLGDIMICSERVISQAKEYGHSRLREFAFLVAHSTLHLIGYDHMTANEAKVMEKKQKAYLEELGIPRE